MGWFGGNASKSGLIGRSPAFGRFLAARTASSLGNWITVTALVLYVEGTGASAVAVGALLLARTLPQALGPLAGALVDRVDQRRLMVLCDVGQILLIGSIALFLPPLPVTISLVVATSILWTLFQPAGRSVLPALVYRDDLTQANAFLASSMNIGFAVGPALGGLLVASVGLRGALVADIVTFTVSAILLRTLPALSPVEPDSPQRSSFLASSVEGVSYIVRHSIARAVGVGLFVSVAFAALDNVSLVYLIRDVLDSGEFGYGLALSAWAVGMVMAPLVIVKVAPGIAARSLLLGGLVLTGAGLISTGLSPGLVFALVVLALAGSGNGLENVGTDTLIQQNVPREMLGRVFGTVYAPIFLGESLAYATGGFLLEATSPRFVFFVAGAGVLAAFVLVYRLLPDHLHTERIMR